MDVNQKFTPKYWFVHDVTESDILLWTGSKSMQGSVDKYNEVGSLSFEDDLDLEVVLMSLEVVVL